MLILPISVFTKWHSPMRIMNSEHREQLARLAGKHAEMVACDPDGFDLAAGETITRIAFAERLTATGDIPGAV